MTKKNQVKRTRKKELSSDSSNPCDGCGAECCQYFAVYIDEPTDLEEYDAIKWYLHHDRVCVYIDRHSDWYVHVDVPCRQLDGKGKCRIYESRPKVCRDYKPQACEREDIDVDNIAEFNSTSELDEFFKINFRVMGKDIKRRHRKYRRP